MPPNRRITSAHGSVFRRNAAIGFILLATACSSSPSANTAGAGSGAQSSKPTLSPAQIAAKSTTSIVSIRSPNSLGTGFVVRADGWIATNLHVIAGERELLVVLPDHTEHAVIEIVGIDETRDLAVLRIQVSKPLMPLPLGDSDGVRPGDPVVAIGHPLGLEDTVSNGLVSAVRQVDPSLTVLQISAPIAPGSSGGPLFNDRGEVIGVAAAVSRAGQNLNFGLPIRYVKSILKEPQPIPFHRFVEATAGPPVPKIARNVPHHELSVLQGCQASDLETLAHVLGEAVQVGSALYNAGNFSGCYHVYEGASLDAERKLRPGCRGPKKALGDGRKRAAALKNPSAQAWAMRDSFDGLFDLIGRKMRGGQR
jgi:serine protease Do